MSHDLLVNRGKRVYLYNLCIYNISEHQATKHRCRGAADTKGCLTRMVSLAANVTGRRALRGTSGRAADERARSRASARVGGEINGTRLVCALTARQGPWITGTYFLSLSIILVLPHSLSFLLRSPSLPHFLFLPFLLSLLTPLSLSLTLPPPFLSFARSPILPNLLHQSYSRNSFSLFSYFSFYYLCVSISSSFYLLHPILSLRPFVILSFVRCFFSLYFVYRSCRNPNVKYLQELSV